MQLKVDEERKKAEGFHEDLTKERLAVSGAFIKLNIILPYCSLVVNSPRLKKEPTSWRRLWRHFGSLSLSLRNQYKYWNWSLMNDNDTVWFKFCLNSYGFSEENGRLRLDRETADGRIEEVRKEYEAFKVCEWTILKVLLLIRCGFRWHNLSDILYQACNTDINKFLWF